MAVRAPLGAHPVIPTSTVDVGETTLCMFLTWHQTTTEQEIASAEATIQSLRAEPFGENGVRIVFERFDEWDTG